MRTVSLTAGHARTAASGVQRLAVQRQAAALARAHSNALQIKVAVAVGCTLASVFGYALHRANTSVSSIERTPLVATATSTGSPAERRLGQVQVPYDGETCRRFHFDNANGAILGESFATCGAAEVAQPTTAPLPTRAEAIMSAFRVPR